MNHIEVMKIALDALNNTDTHPISSAEQYFKETQAMEALEDAIKDAEEQKPICKDDLQIEIGKREWVGLTDEEIEAIQYDSDTEVEYELLMKVTTVRKSISTQKTLPVQSRPS